MVWLGDVVGGPRVDPLIEGDGDPQEHLLAQSLVWWEGCLEWLRCRLKERDRSMEEQYRRQHRLAQLGVAFEF